MVSPARKRTISLLTNPFILAAIPTVALFIIIPVLHQSYILDLQTSVRVPENYYHSYADLDGDGNSEKIIAFDNPNGAGITISRNNIILNQWNIAGTFDFSKKSTLSIPADCNGDGISELYIFSIYGDSILLHSLGDPADQELTVRNRLIDITGRGQAAPDPVILEAEPQDLNGDGRVELLFGITSGFSKHPRKVYAYYPDRDSLISSPPLGGFILGIEQEDLDNDGIPEILPYGYAAGNIRPSEIRHHDRSAWLMVLDRNLEFTFEPLEFRGNFTLATPLVMKSEKNEVRDYLVYSLETDSLASLVTFTPAGEITQRTAIPVRPYWALMTSDRRKELLYAFSDHNGSIVLFDHKKRFLREIEYPGAPVVFQRDLDLDGTSEIIVYSQETGRLQVYRPGFRQPAGAVIGSGFGSGLILSVIREQKEYPGIFLQSGTSQYIFTYRRNPMFYLSFGLYPMVYSAFIAFVLLIQSTQQRAMARKEEEKKKISELQLALIRNQLDPHFTLNALNSVLHLVEQSDREKARESLLRFSGLYRDLLLSAGKSRRTLEEELEFCREYLDLEKIRYGNRFNFVIQKNEEVNYDLKVPKLVIQLFAENSVKHGIATLESGGLLLINVTGKGNELSVIIKDNGVGRARAAEEQTGSTGKGMKLMNELFDLCNRHFEDTYSFTVSDLTGSDGHPEGTEVKVSIRYGQETVTIS